MPRLEIRELEYFIAVAEELHFTRAAARLGIAQPPLSRAIVQLERRVGARLLTRSSRQVALTGAGHTLLGESRKILKAIDGALVRTRRESTPRLTLALRAGSGQGLLADLVAAPPAGVDLTFTYDAGSALRDGQADLAVLCEDTDDMADLQSVRLAIEEPFALIPRASAISGLARVSRHELTLEPSFSDPCPPIPMDEILDRVATGSLMAIVGISAASRLPQGVVAIPVFDMAPTRLVVAWRENTNRPDVAAFVHHARQVAARHSAAKPSAA